MVPRGLARRVKSTSAYSCKVASPESRWRTWRGYTVTGNSFLRQPILGHLMRHDYRKAMTVACVLNESTDAPMSNGRVQAMAFVDAQKAGFTKRFCVGMTSAKKRGWRCGNHHQPASLNPSTPSFCIIAMSNAPRRLSETCIHAHAKSYIIDSVAEVWR
jgi:hypothetical protein